VKADKVLDIILGVWLASIALVALVHASWPFWLITSLVFTIASALIVVNYRGLAARIREENLRPPRTRIERWSAQLNERVGGQHWTVGTYRFYAVFMVLLGLIGSAGAVAMSPHPVLHQAGETLFTGIMIAGSIGIVLLMAFTFLVPLYNKLMWARYKQRKIAPPHMIDDLNNADPLIRTVAAMSLGKVGDPQSLGPLTHLLEDPETDVRLGAALALAQMSEPQSIAPLISNLESARPDLREYVLEALSKQRASIVPLLVHALRHDEIVVRAGAADLLAELGDANAVLPLIHALNDADWQVRQQATIALGKRGDPRAIQPLVALLHDEEGEVRAAAAWALADLQAAEAVPALQQLAQCDRGTDYEGYPVSHTASAAIKRIHMHARW
jgi:hypothetical protein